MTTTHPPYCHPTSRPQQAGREPVATPRRCCKEKKGLHRNPNLTGLQETQLSPRYLQIGLPGLLRLVVLLVHHCLHEVGLPRQPLRLGRVGLAALIPLVQHQCVIHIDAGPVICLGGEHIRPLLEQKPALGHHSVVVPLPPELRYTFGAPVQAQPIPLGLEALLLVDRLHGLIRVELELPLTLRALLRPPPAQGGLAGPLLLPHLQRHRMHPLLHEPGLALEHPRLRPLVQHHRLVHHHPHAVPALRYEVGLPAC
mmetsp:Transcript_68650/g.182891  ORF Transcript_68650/g.182891 Transcript_68650/m.182891 type:complete len:255 (-) Transcript_68650:2829-3593(-)